MPACRQCGKDNPEGTVVCGYCAAPVSSDASAEPRARASAPIHKVIHTPPAAPKLAKGAYPIEPPPVPKAKRAIEWIAWSELTAGQKAGRLIATLLLLLMIFFLLRSIFGRVGSPGESRAVANPRSTESPLTGEERADGLASLCPTIGIYGIPQDDTAAVEVARHADDLFKMAGNRPPERSIFILTTLARGFQNGALKSSDCPPRSLLSASPTPTMLPTPR